MTDAILIVEGVVAQVWRNTPVDAVPVPEVGELIAMGAGEAVCGMLWDGDELSLPTPPLAGAKAVKLAALANERWGRTQAFSYDGETDVPADPALSVITSLAVADQIMPSGGATRTFKLKSPAVFREWTVAEIVAYGMAIGVHVQACFDREKALAAEIQAAADHAALDAIDITAGWP